MKPRNHVVLAMLKTQKKGGKMIDKKKKLKDTRNVKHKKGEAFSAPLCF